VRRERRVVLKDLDLEVSAGELVCLLGPNGIGKSTLLRTIAKMQPPLDGSIELGGTDLGHLSHADLARRLGIVLTERLAIGALSAQRIVELGRYPHSGWFGSLTPHDRDIVHWAIDVVGAHHFAAHDFNRLSDGERQRIMIARALAQEPVLLLLDEPTAFLDVPSRVELMGLLRLLARDEPLAVVVSTHDLELALRTADTVWLVQRDGHVCAGAPEDVVLSGQVAATFETARNRFRADERTFRLQTGERGIATVLGTGLHATLAAAVLEREGYEVLAASRVPSSAAPATPPAAAPAAAASSSAPPGLRAERRVEPHVESGVQLSVEIDEQQPRWTVSTRAGSYRGEGFKALATCVRTCTSSPAAK
jgi:iron complex transport system ATP-binding protein